MSQHTFGPNTTPPPGLRGDLMEPCLALPLPFWANGFLPPPLTSALVFVLAVPYDSDSGSAIMCQKPIHLSLDTSTSKLTARAFCLTVTRYLCTSPFAVSRAATRKDRFCEPEDSPSKALTSSVAGLATIEALVTNNFRSATTLCCCSLWRKKRCREAWTLPTLQERLCSPKPFMLS